MQLRVATRAIEGFAEFNALVLRVAANIEWERETSDMHRALAAQCRAQRLTTHWTRAE
jgi:hypothetical protein